MNKIIKYKVCISKSALADIKSIKKYILQTFTYRSYAENFSTSIKRAINELETFPYGYKNTEFTIDGQIIYLKPYQSYLIFFVVDNHYVTIIRILKNRMHWQNILNMLD